MMGQNAKYDDGVERGALCIEGVCSPKAGRTASTKRAMTGKGYDRLKKNIGKLQKMHTNAHWLLEDKIVFLQTPLPSHILFRERPQNNRSHAL